MAFNRPSSCFVSSFPRNTMFMALLCLGANMSDAQEVRVQKASVAANAVGLNIQVANTTSVAVSKLKVQYFLDPSDHGSDLVVEVDYTNAASLAKSFAKTSDNLGVVTFDLGSESIPAGATREINARLHLASWGAMDFTNDYSYIGLGSSMTVASRLALYKGSSLVFGTLPAGSGSGSGGGAAHMVAITNPAKSMVVSTPTIPVEWTVDGKRQFSQVQEELKSGSNLVFRCFEDACAAVEVYRLDAPLAYEANNSAPDWNGNMVSLRSTAGLTMNDRAVVRAARVQVGGSFSEGYDAKVFATLEVAQNVTLKDRAALHGAYALGGTTQFGAQVAVDAEKGAYTAPTTAMPDVPAVVAGDAVVFASGMFLPPGKYASLTIPQEATLVVGAGSYSFTALTFASDAKVVIEGVGPVVVDVNNLVVGDRVVTTFSNSVKHGGLTFRSSQSEPLSIGYDAKIEGDLLAPQASVTLQDRVAWSGSVWAKSIIVGHDAVVDGNVASRSILDAVVKKIGSDGLENLRLTSSRGVLHISSAKINKMKRVELLPIWGDSGFTYLDEMGLARSYAPYHLEYSPKSPFFMDEGLKLSAADAVVVGSETIDGIDCWKVRIPNYVAPWYFLAHFPESELMSANAVVWFAKQGSRLVRIDLSVDDPRFLPFTEEDVPATPIGKVTYRIATGECTQMPYFAANQDVVRYRVVVKADGSNPAGTGLSEIAFYQAGARVSPILSQGDATIVVGRKIKLGQKGWRELSDTTKVFNEGDRIIEDAWKLFNGEGVDDGWLDLSTIGDFEFDVVFANGARPDEIRISGPTDPAAGPSSIEVLASTDGTDWKSIGKDASLSWQAFEIKSRSLSWDRLARTCIPRSLDVSVPGLVLDESDIGFQQWSDLRTSGEMIDLHRTTVDTRIMTMPEATESDFQRKYSLLAEYKKRALDPWFGIFWQVRSGIATRGTGVHLDFAVQDEVGLPFDYFRLTHDMPKVTR